MAILDQSVSKRRTFAIIAHPDAGKTTLTEKLLLYGGAIQLAGTVKAKRGKKFATSDWLAIEKQRGISVTSSVLSFPYNGFHMNLIDTPGHQDFSEDTYRTLTAVDCALMLIDGANGVEAQTIKLFEVCRLRGLPMISFINKMDRPGKTAFDLIDNIEQVLGITCCPMTWPIGHGPDFRGVYDRLQNQLMLFDRNSDRAKPVPLMGLDLDDPALENEIGKEHAETLRGEIEILNGAVPTFNSELFLQGKQVPVFFGSALNNFGVQSLLEALIEFAPPPLPRPTKSRLVQPNEEKLTGFVFKIQANMDPNHRDRVAFMRICSGAFVRGMKAYHVRDQKFQRLGSPTQFMAQDRSFVDEAFAGDIIGIRDPGSFRIGDTISEGEDLTYIGIPVFAPEHFARVILKDPMRNKQLNKALDQLSEEGAVQVFRPTVDSSEKILGVVGALQFDVVKYRVEAEYGVDIAFHPMAYAGARWLRSDNALDLKTFISREQSHVCYDHRGDPVILIDYMWKMKPLTERNPTIRFLQTSGLETDI